jgi:thiosulfate/3-mercaptopyruvate sulfurtransferase
MDSLVSTRWLAENLGAADLRIVDAAQFLPDAGRDAAAEYESAHIPGAVFMDLAGLADTNSPYPSTLPKPEKFASRMQSLGLGDGSRIVLYDNAPHKTAARAWWMLSQVFGAHGVAILDGGLAKWVAENRPTDKGKVALRHRHFTVWKDDKAVRTLDEMKANLNSKAEQVIDARGAARFSGEEAETRPGLASGHIPGALNLPYDQMFNSDGTWKQGDALKAAFTDVGVDLDAPMVMSCGSGITASVLAFGAHLLGKTAPVYDGSWSEWGAQDDTPKATGAA